jgi:hypothetical protein
VTCHEEWLGHLSDSRKIGGPEGVVAVALATTARELDHIAAWADVLEALEDSSITLKQAQEALEGLAEVGWVTRVGPSHLQLSRPRRQPRQNVAGVAA